MNRVRAEEHLVVLDELRGCLASLLVIGLSVDGAAWSQLGSLLGAVDRLRVEIVTAPRGVTPAHGQWNDDTSRVAGSKH